MKKSIKNFAELSAMMLAGKNNQIRNGAEKPDQMQKIPWSANSEAVLVELSELLATEAVQIGS